MAKQLTLVVTLVLAAVQVIRSQTATTYYVATGDRFANNTTCTGLVAVGVDSTKCPFKDFTGSAVRNLLHNARGVTISVRAGVYSFPGGSDDGLVVQGIGASEAERVVVQGYNGETAILDGNYTARSVVRLEGRYVTVKGLTVRNGGGYNVEVRGTTSFRFENNRLLANGSSDSFKCDGWSSGVVLNNYFTGWQSQAMDLTECANLEVAYNTMDTPGNAAIQPGGIGMKKGARDYRIHHNLFRNMYLGIAMGGTSSAHPEPYEATRILVEDNAFEQIANWAVDFYSCVACTFRNNTIVSSGAAFLLSNDVSKAWVSLCNNGGERCRENSQITISDNRRIEVSSRYAFGLNWTSPVPITITGNGYCTTSVKRSINGYDVTDADWFARTGETVGSCNAGIGPAPPTNVRVVFQHARVSERFKLVGWNAGHIRIQGLGDCPDQRKGMPVSCSHSQTPDTSDKTRSNIPES